MIRLNSSKTALAAALVSASLCSAPLCSAQQTVIISNAYSSSSIGNGLRIGQGSAFDSASFRFQMGSVAYDLEEVDLRGSFVLCSGNVTPLLTIRADVGGQPGAILATLTPAGVLAGPDWYTFDAPPNTTLDANTIYWLDGRPQPGGTCFGWGGTSPPVPPTGDHATALTYIVNSGGTPPGNAMLRLELRGTPSGPFSNYCGPSMPNSTGASAEITGQGSATLSQNDLVLVASNLPQNAFGFFLVSRQQGFTANPGGSAGNLCLGNQIGRYIGPGQVQNSGASGTFTLAVDWTQIPQPTMTVAAMVGDQWNFQAWFRDALIGLPTSNFTDGLSVTVE